jgi:adenylosuccinate synthase
LHRDYSQNFWSRSIVEYLEIPVLFKEFRTLHKFFKNSLNNNIDISAKTCHLLLECHMAKDIQKFAFDDVDNFSIKSKNYMLILN